MSARSASLLARILSVGVSASALACSSSSKSPAPATSVQIPASSSSDAPATEPVATGSPSENEAGAADLMPQGRMMSPFKRPVRTTPPQMVSCKGQAPSGIVSCMSGELQGGELRCMTANTPQLDEDLKWASGGCPLVEKVLSGPYCTSPNDSQSEPRCCYAVVGNGCVGRPLLIGGGVPVVAMLRRGAGAASWLGTPLEIA